MCIKTNLLDQLVQFFRQSGHGKVVLVALGLLQLISLITAILTVYVDHLNIHFLTPPLFEEKTIVYAFITGIIISPVVETLIFQWFIYKVFKRFKFFRNQVRYIILVSAFLFGMAHFYHLYYMIGTFFSGIIYMSVYISKVSNKKLAYWLAVLTHSLSNAIALSLLFMSESFVV